MSHSLFNIGHNLWAYEEVLSLKLRGPNAEEVRVEADEHFSVKANDIPEENYLG